MSSLRLWVDDIRNPVDFDRPDWHWCRTVTEAIRILSSSKVDEVSLDHDICHTLPGDSAIVTPLACPEDYTAVAHYIALMPADERPNVVWIHTASESGAGRLHNILYGKVEDVIRRRL